MTPRRVAFFTDSFHEVNGVALTSRRFVNYAQRRALPLLSVHAGPEDTISQSGSVITFEFARGPVRWNLEHDLALDILFWKHRSRLRAALREFQPDLGSHHRTWRRRNHGPSRGARARCASLAASWHTNLHEFGATRLMNFLRFLPAGIRSAVGSQTEKIALDLCMRFYRFAKVTFAPNPELVDMLAKRTGRPAFLMIRGINTDLFSPARRIRKDAAFVLGYVGRLSPEKNVRMVADLDHALRGAGLRDFRFLIIGEGSERTWLRERMPSAELPGILRGEELARAYASMDVFVFPSFADTFGNVVLEAMASGVPAIVASSGGPKFLVERGRTGFVATTVPEFANAILSLARDRALRAVMGSFARKAAERFSWDRVIGEVYQNYDACFSPDSAPLILRPASAPSPASRISRSSASPAR